MSTPVLMGIIRLKGKNTEGIRSTPKERFSGDTGNTRITVTGFLWSAGSMCLRFMYRYSLISFSFDGRHGQTF
jgi:hypothetical protein